MCNASDQYVVVTDMFCIFEAGLALKNYSLFLLVIQQVVRIGLKIAGVVG